MKVHVTGKERLVGIGRRRFQRMLGEESRKIKRHRMKDRNHKWVLCGSYVIVWERIKRRLSNRADLSIKPPQSVRQCIDRQ